MSHRIHAVYDGKVLLPEDESNLEPNARYLLIVEKEEPNGDVPRDAPYPLSVIRDLATDMKVSDLAERHDAYAHQKLEETEGLAG